MCLFNNKKMKASGAHTPLGPIVDMPLFSIENTFITESYLVVA